MNSSTPVAKTTSHFGSSPGGKLAALGVREEHHQITEVLIRPDETPAFVFFLYAGAVVSIVRSTENGSMVEAGVTTGSGAIVQIEDASGRSSTPVP